MNKKIMSIAAAAAIMTTGAVAFDTNNDGDLLNRNAKLAKYTVDANTSTDPQVLMRPRAWAPNMDALKGDALIFPAFKMGEGWETEIAFRNNHTDKAVLAKVVVYAADDSSEIVDFNVYLSSKDQVRFTMTDAGVIESRDGSIVTRESFANNNENAIKFADEVPFALNVTKQDGSRVNEGYVVVYAMAQTQGDDQGFHADHKHLWKAYREQLDAQRPGWNVRTNYREGVYTEQNITAPNLHLSGDVFENPVINTLSGTERVINTTGEVRDLLIAPVALANFTTRDNDTGLLWAPGEYATLADRCIDDIDQDGYGEYDADCLIADTNTFLLRNATYTYENAAGALGSVANKLVVTQPTKRFMVQRGLGNTYWSTEGCNQSADNGSAVTTGRTYGFTASLDIRNEAELTIGQSEDSYEQITSPYRPELTEESAYCTELVEANNIEEESTGFAADVNGFVTFTFSGEDGLPAIVSQMTATRVNEENARINWIYSPADSAAN